MRVLVLLGRLLCALGAVAILLLGLDLLAGHAGFQFPGDMMRFLILMPLAVIGALIAFLMVRRYTGVSRTRRLLLISAMMPPTLVLVLFGAAQLFSGTMTHGLLVGFLMFCWAVYALTILRSGQQLRRQGHAAMTGLCLFGVGIGLLVQSLGTVARLVMGPEAAWPGELSFYGIVVAASLMAMVMAIVAVARSTPAVTTVS
ncbi:MAG: hypothetical protein OXC93_02415 [Rhodospirillaceae bacterium]|nr:hypothetical protein [Rhodospirillaceae bacterium]